MKRCVLHGMIAMMMCGIAVAHSNHAQLLEKKITLKVNDVPLEAVLQLLEQQAGIKFFYSREHVDLEEKVSVVADDKSLKAVFEELFGSLRIRYLVHEKDSTVTLKRQKHVVEAELADPPHGSIQLPLYTLPPSISGVVTDAQSQQPMAGVNVIVKGTLKGTSTDSDGRYMIEANHESDVLVFSFIGFKTVEVQVGGRTVIDAALEEDISRLSEVTVSTGYWEVDKKYSTGNIVKITSKEIEKQPVNNPILALQGRVAGLNIQQSSGVAGGSFATMQIRGQNSVRKGENDPLIVINGIPYPSKNLSNHSMLASNVFPSPLNTINPLDIESIEILKDADATAIYGSLGANGVILITTKKPVAGGTSVSFNIYSGIGEVANKADLLNTQQYLGMRREAFTNDGVAPTAANAPDLMVWDTTRYTDWQEELIGGVAHITNAQLSLSGGTDLTRILVSGGYFRETTVFPGEFPYQKGSLNFTGSHNSRNEKVSISFTSNLVLENSKLPTEDLTFAAVTLPPNAPEPFTEDNAINWENNTWFNNPYAFSLNEYNGKTTNLITNLNFSYEFIKNLKIEAGLGYNLIRNDLKNIIPIAANPPTSFSTGSNTVSNNEGKTWIAEPRLNYTNNFGKGKLETTIGLTFRETIQSGVAITGTGYSSDAFITNLAAASTLKVMYDNYSEYRYSAVYGRIGYNWDGRYILNFSGRRDASSRFGVENRIANFGAVAGAWIFSQEGFLTESSILSFGKLKVSFGVVGNDQIGNYSYLSSYVTTAPYRGTNGLVPIRLGNPEYQWENVKKLEFGIELGFLKDRVLFNTYYYRNRSSNQLVEFPLPLVTGFGSITSNLDAVVQNSGFEFELSTVNFNSVFKWSSSINLTIPNNKLIDFPNLEGSNYAQVYRVGEPLTIDLLYKSMGINSDGIYQFEDFDGDGIITEPADKQQIVNRSQKFYGGFQNSLGFKGFHLDFLFQFVNQPTANYSRALGNSPGSLSNQPTMVLARWQTQGEITDVQRFTRGGPASTAHSRYRSSDASVTDGSFVRLKNVSLSYDLPNTVLHKLKFQKVQVYVQAQNLFTFTEYEFLDPETYVLLPPLRVITAGLQFTL